MPDYRVVALYPFDLQTYRDQERELESIVGARTDGGGTDWEGRDVEWYFKTKAKATEALRKLRKVKWVTRSKLEKCED